MSKKRARSICAEAVGVDETPAGVVEPLADTLEDTDDEALRVREAEVDADTDAEAERDADREEEGEGGL
jgi:hypothetical protein